MAVPLLHGRNCFVTGSTRGIGAALVKELAENGARVICHARTESASKETIEKLNAHLTGRNLKLEEHIPVWGDLADADAAAEAIASQLDSAGLKDLHVLIHNAGVLGKTEPLEKVSTKDLQDTLNVNVLAPHALTKALLPWLRKADRPSIMFVSSGAGRRRESGLQGMGAYSISKFGVEGLSCLLAQELRSEGIRVNALNPGPTRTEMRATLFPREDPSHLPTPSQILPLFLWLSRADTQLTNASENCADWRGIDWKTHVPGSIAFKP